MLRRLSPGTGHEHHQQQYLDHQQLHQRTQAQLKQYLLQDQA